MLSEEQRMEIGELFFARRKELQMTQDEMCQLLMAYGISEYTYKRAERGKAAVSLSALARIADAMKVDLNAIIPNVMNLKFLVMNSLDKEQHFHDANAEIYYTLSHSESNDAFHRLNLFRFLLYLPLFTPESLFEVLHRIGGDFVHREGYIISQLEWLFRQIPESSALRFAKQVDKYILHIADEENEREKEWIEDFVTTEHSYKAEYAAYMKKVDCQQDAFYKLKCAMLELEAVNSNDIINKDLL